MAAGIPQLALVIEAGQAQRIQAGDSVTGLSGAAGGFDVSTAGSMEIGANTATSLQLGKAAVDTTVAGQLLVKEGAGEGIDVAAAGSLEIGILTATSINIGKIGDLTTIKGDLTVDGAEIVVGTTTFGPGATAINGNLTVGNAVTDTMVINSILINRLVAPTAPLTIVFDGTQSHQMAIQDQATPGSAGGSMVFSGGGKGGDGSGADAPAGGLTTYESGVGGDAVAAFDGGPGGVLGVHAGNGGIGTAGVDGGAGGLLELFGGTGGVAGSGVQGVGGGIDARGGAGSTAGTILIGTADTSTITIGLAGLTASGIPTTINHAVIAGSPAAATRNSNLLSAISLLTAGSNSIGVNIVPLTNSSPGNADLQTVLEALDTASGGGGTLNAAYVLGNTIAVEAVDGPVAISNSEGLTDTLTITRTFAGAGRGLFIDMGPGSQAVTGIGLDIAMGSGATGNAVNVVNGGTGDIFFNNTSSGAITFQDGGNDVLDISAIGLLTLSPSSGQDLAVTVAGAGQVEVSSAAALNPLLNITSASESDTTANYAESIQINSTGTGAQSVSILVGDADPNGDVLAGDVGSLYLDATNGTAYIKTGAPSTWVALASGAGNTLQQAYVAGPDITQNNTQLGTTIDRGTNAEAAAMWQFTDSSAVAQAVVTISKTGAVAGAGLSITQGASTTGAALFANGLGSGNVVQFQDGGNDVLAISGAGAVLVTPTSGQNVTLTAAGAGGVYSNAVEGAIQLTQTSVAAAQPGDVGFQSTNSNAAGTSADVLIGTAATGGGTVGSIVMRAGTAAAAGGNPGNVEVYASDTFTAQAVTVTEQASTGNATFEATVGSTSTAGAWVGGSKQTGAGASGNAGLVSLLSELSGQTDGTGSTGGVLIASRTTAATTGVQALGNVTIESTSTSNSGTMGDIVIGSVGSNGATVGGVGITTGNGHAAPAAGEIKLNASGDVDVDSSANIELDALGGFSIDAGTASNVSVTTGDLTISTITNGTLAVTSAGILDLDGTSVTVDSSGAISIDGVTNSNISLSGAAAVLTLASTDAAGDVAITAGATSGEINFTARGGTVGFNEADFTVGGTTVEGQTLDTSFTAASIIGAINELRLGSESVLAVSKVASENIQAGAPVSMHDSTGPKIREGDATSADLRTVLIGIAPLAITSAATGLVVTAGEVAVPDAAWAAAEGGVPATSNVGDIVFLATEIGHLALTAPSGGTNTVVKVGVVTVGGAGAVKVLIKPFDTIKL